MNIWNCSPPMLNGQTSEKKGHSGIIISSVFLFEIKNFSIFFYHVIVTVLTGPSLVSALASGMVNGPRLVALLKLPFES